MNNFRVADELDQAIERLIANPEAEFGNADLEISELLGIAGELRTLPAREFRMQLKAELLERPAEWASLFAAGPEAWKADRVALWHADVEVSREILPTLFGGREGNYPLHQRSFAASLAMHVMLLALVVSSGVWAAKPGELKSMVTSHVIYTRDYPLPPAPDKASGGGGGGAHEKLQASAGSPPPFSREQITPPATVVPTEKAKLTTQPTVVGPPNVVFPPAAQMGDPLSAALTPSNGPGSAAGIGDGDGTGVGKGDGPGVGDGRGGGIDGGFYSAGMGGVTAPRPIYDPTPEYSDEARVAKYQGDVVLWAVIGVDGRAHNLRVQRSLGMGLDEKALEAVNTWRFEPGSKDGRPVAVQVSIEVSFRLF